MKPNVPMPVVDTYRGVGVHAYQSTERISTRVKPAIDFVFELDDPEELFSYACSPANPPEARVLAKARLTAMIEDRTSHRLAARIDLQMLNAGTAGIACEWADNESYGSLFEAIHFPGVAAPRPAEYGEAMRKYFSDIERNRLLAAGWVPDPVHNGKLTPPGGRS